eukprot:CAMPEP_0117522306 /NCGR_PEP_ID=MMETSP0784-20121206/34139_1 /TAXON_ID=39447 /ORGANISM="" /LENGTH=73 /DNA_ID=CAMNT_0005318373 /DNA_START=384 /DNA_END=605 /DNA_ORIENTATION=+
MFLARYTGNCSSNFVRLQLAHVSEVGHDGDVPFPVVSHPPQQFYQVISIRVGGESLWPERQGAGADTEVLDVW